MYLKDLRLRERVFYFFVFTLSILFLISQKFYMNETPVLRLLIALAVTVSLISGYYYNVNPLEPFKLAVLLTFFNLALVTILSAIFYFLVVKNLPQLIEKVDYILISAVSSPLISAIIFKIFPKEE